MPRVPLKQIDPTSVADGDFLKRSGNDIVGAAASGVLKQVPKFNTLSTDQTTVSVTFVDLLSVTITISAGSDLIVTVTAAVSSSGSNNNANIRLLIDGVAQQGAQEELKSSDISASLAIRCQVSGLAAGARTVKLQWKTNASTLRCRPATVPDSEHACLIVEEVG